MVNVVNNKIVMGGETIVDALTIEKADNGAGAGPDFYLIKTDSQGNATSTFNIPISNANRKLQKIVDVLGREVNPTENTQLFYIYNDGSVEKKIIIE